MSAAGQELVAGRIPGERINTTIRTSNSAAFTAETSVDNVVANLVIGRTYRIRWVGALFSSVADGYARGRIREDTVAGTQLQLRQQPTNVAASQAFGLIMEVEYTAVATGAKTFHATMARQSGTGNITCTAAADTPTYLYVEYVRG